MPRLSLPSCCFRSSFWLIAFLVWVITLWVISDGPAPAPPGPGLPGIDKLLHFGYFFGGAGLLSATLYLRRAARTEASWRRLLITVVVLLAAIGALDEWHQSWIPERSGNDLGDWIADVAGALAGGLVFRRLHPLLHPENPDPEDSS